LSNATTRGQAIRIAALVVLGAIIVRVGALLWYDDALTDDPDGYAMFAHRLAGAGTFGTDAGQPSAYRPPTYPVLLVPWCLHLPPVKWGIAGLHFFATAIIVWCTLRLARRFTTSPWATALAGVVVAVDPLLVRQSTLIMTETVHTALFVWLLDCWLCELSRDDTQRRPPAAAVRTALGIGLLLSATALTRPITWPVWLAVGFVSMRENRGRHWLWVSLGGLAFCAPWILRNVYQFGSPILTTTHGGYTLWLGQNPVYYREVVVGGHSYWPADSHRRWTQENARLTAGMSEIERDRYFRSQAWAWMRSDPRAALRTIVHHWGSLWSPAPRNQPPGIRQLCGGFYATVYLLAVIGLIATRNGKSARRIFVAACLAVTLVHAVYWSDIRMRAPLIPLLAALSAVGAERLFGTIPAIRAVKDR
jgi:hypothetical protein